MARSAASQQLSGCRKTGQQATFGGAAEGHMPPNMQAVANALVADGKGILAADETPGTLTRRFEARGIASTADSRRAYREMLFSAPGLENYISGVILQDETLRQSASKGVPFPQNLADRG